MCLGGRIGVPTSTYSLRLSTNGTSAVDSGNVTCILTPSSWRRAPHRRNKNESAPAPADPRLRDKLLCPHYSPHSHRPGLRRFGCCSDAFRPWMDQTLRERGRRSLRVPGGYLRRLAPRHLVCRSHDIHRANVAGRSGPEPAEEERGPPVCEPKDAAQMFA